MPKNLLRINSAKQNMEEVVIPRANDILLGYAGNNSKHSSNVLLQLVCRQALKRYSKAPKNQKVNISLEIFRTISCLKSRGCQGRTAMAIEIIFTPCRLYYTTYLLIVIVL